MTKGSVTPAIDIGFVISSYVEAIEKCRSIREVADVMQVEALRHGMTAVACGMVTGPKALTEDPFYFNNWPSDWMALYKSRGFIEKDAVPRWALNSGAPITWSALKLRLSASDPAHQVFKAGLGFGFREGLVSPVRTGSGHLGLISLGGDRDAFSKAEVTFLHVHCTQTIQKLETLWAVKNEQELSSKLTIRERECAALLIQGHGYKAIAIQLGIRAATVKFHISNARMKIGVRSRTQLAALLPLMLKDTPDRR